MAYTPSLADISPSPTAQANAGGYTPTLNDIQPQGSGVGASSGYNSAQDMSSGHVPQLDASGKVMVPQGSGPSPDSGMMGKLNAFGGGAESLVGITPRRDTQNAMDENPNTAQAGALTGALTAGATAGAVVKATMATGAVGADAAAMIVNNFTSSALMTPGSVQDKVAGGVVGTVAGAAAGKVMGMAGNAINAGYLSTKIQDVLDVVSQKLMGKSTNEAAAQAASNTWNTAIAQADQAFAGFRGVAGKVTGQPIASQAQDLLDKYAESLNPLQKQVLKSMVIGGNDAANLADLHQVRKMMSLNYTKFNSNSVTVEMGNDLRQFGDFTEAHLQQEANKLGALPAYENANAIWKGTVLPLRSFGIDDVANALNPANAVKDPATANKIMDSMWRYMFFIFYFS